MADAAASALRAEEFDEERCRDFFVHELGVEIPRFYRYAEGIHEVRKRILLRYGDMNFGPVMALFRELLEQDDNAAGLGDDGDLWRSWRHDYKNRGEDYSNPGTPNFPGLILPASPPARSAYVPLSLEMAQDGLVESLTTSHDPTGPGRAVLSVAHDDASAGLSPASAGIRSASGTGVHAGVGAGASASASASAAAGTSAWRGHGTQVEGMIRAGQRAKAHSTTKWSIRKLMSRRLFSTFSRSKDEWRPPVPPKDDHLVTRKPSKQKSRDQSLPQLPPLSLDGACDRPDHRQDNSEQGNNNDQQSPVILCSSFAYLHTTPFTPLGFLSSDLMEHHTSGPASQRSQPSQASTGPRSAARSATTSSGTRSNASSKEGFRSITRNLIHPTRPTTPPGFLGNFSPLEPTKYLPPSTPSRPAEMADAYERYASMAGGNPFQQDRGTNWPAAREEPAALMTGAPCYSPSKPTHLHQSQSEGNLTFLPGPSPTKHSVERESRPVAAAAALPSHERGSPSRGRSRSSVKFLDDVPEEEAEVSLPPSPVARSRSPMKKMFGEKGWLGRSASYKDMGHGTPKKGLKHWGGRIKQRVEGLTEDMTRLMPNPFPQESAASSSGPSPAPRKFAVSLDPMMQSKLQSEAELMICVTANQFLMQQRKEGRMSVESLVKVTERWKNQGRPQVIEFQFDQATQRELVMLNLKSFRFFGQHMESAMGINTMLYNWKTVAKEMAVRTFCTPDTVIRKHLHDIYLILELLGAPLSTFLAFQEIQLRTLKTIREEQARRDAQAQIQYGVERAWRPPTAEGRDGMMLGDPHH
ncbi:MAG: hypothetical protein M1838_000818 [Thelocarpon superellum]|nr:MAG: hypothetical protein M1838_000818 [Thelocarpon superellum]